MPYSPIGVLNSLYELQTELGSDWYAEGFELIAYGDASGLEAWSVDRGFLNKLVPFAQANASGSLYALWSNAEGNDPTGVPVVIFGDEGGQHVVAGSLAELLQIVGYDAEAGVDHEEVYFYRDPDDYEPSAGRERYVQWLADELSVEPAEDPAAVVAAAQREFGAMFESWSPRSCGNDQSALQSGQSDAVESAMQSLV